MLKNRTILRKISRRGDETQSENSERSNFSEFCERTSLHGWQHIHRVNTRKGRIVWLSIVLASLSVALLFLTTATKGQLISEANFKVFISTKNRTKIFL